MRERPRRRRADDEPSGGGLPLFPLILVVILAGLLLGGVLAHFFGGSAATPRPERTVVVAQAPSSTPSPLLPAPSPTRSPTTAPTTTPTTAPTPSPTTRPSTRPTPQASATPTPLPSTAPTRTPMLVHQQHVIVATPRPASSPTLATATPKSLVANEDPAASFVRSYLGALARGDRATARTYLASGSPSETFMNAGSQITSIRSSPLQGTRYTVAADVRNADGEYYVTFTLESGPDGLKIITHDWTKPQ